MKKRPQSDQLIRGILFSTYVRNNFLFGSQCTHAYCLSRMRENSA